MNLEDHPIASIFPLMPDDEIAVLAEDIASNSQRDPIWLLDGKILDGRNRYRACVLVGVEPRTEQYTGNDPLGFVISKNLHRRHLDVSQRAMVAAKISTAKQGERRDLEPSRNSGKVTQEEAAKLLNVSADSVGNAAKVLANGVPSLQKAVESGQASASAAAAVADLPKREQREAVRTGTVAETAAEKIAREKRLKQRNIWITLIGQVQPKLKKKILADPEQFSDEMLESNCPPSCSQCLRGIWPALGRPCDACARVRAEVKAKLSEAEQEPEYPEDPASRPKMPERPFKQLKSDITKLSGDMTKAMKQPTDESRRLKEILAVAGLVEHSTPTEFFFLPLRGVRALVEAAEDVGMPLSDAKIRDMYLKASGGKPFLPPLHARRRAARGK